MSEKVDTSRIQEWDDKAGDCCDDLNHVSGNDWPIEVIGEAREIIRALLAANESLAKDAERYREIRDGRGDRATPSWPVGETAMTGAGMSDVAILPVKPGTLSKSDKAALRKAGVVVIEHEYPADLRLLKANETVDATGMLLCAMRGVMRDSTAKQVFADNYAKLLEQAWEERRAQKDK